MALLVAACGSGADGDPRSAGSPTTVDRPAPPVVVESDDGGLRLEIPDGALPSGVTAADITITALSADDLPGPLAGARLSSAFYSLEPDGLTFEAPVTVVRRFDAAQAGIDPAAGLRSAYLLTSTPAGEDFALLDDQVVTADGTDQVVSATTTHFSYVYAMLGAATVDLEPPSVIAGVGEPFGATTTRPTKEEGAEAFAYLTTDGVRPVATGAVQAGTLTCSEQDSDRLGETVCGRATGEYRCSDEGSGTYGVEGILEEVLGLGVRTFLADTDVVRARVVVTGEATCLPAAAPGTGTTVAPGPPVLTAIEVCWVHTPFGTFPSFLAARGSVAPSPPAGSQLEMALGTANGGRPVRIPLEDGAFEGQLGIDAMVPYPVDRVVLLAPDGTTADLTADAGRLLGGPVAVVPEPGCAGR